MDLASPYILFLILILPILFIWFVKEKNDHDGPILFSSSKLIPQNILKKSHFPIKLLTSIKVVIFLLIIIALSGPRLSNFESSQKKEVVDILLVLDQSSSMLAQDFEPNRLEAAKLVANEFVKNRIGDRIGLVVFAANSYIHCPLTTDTKIINNFIDKIKIIDRDSDGTAIGMAIANAINRLRFSETKSKIIILLSDGSNNSGEIDPITAAELAEKFNIKIYTIAAGTNGLAPYPVEDIWGRTIIRNIEVEVDEKTLIEIANLTNAKFFRATDNNSLEQIFKEIDQMEKTKIEIIEYNNYKEIYYYFTIPALLLSLFYMLITRIYFRKI